MTEDELNEAVRAWREIEDSARITLDLAEAAKAKVIDGMHDLGLKSQVTKVGTVTLSQSTKTNIVVDRKEFESKLKREHVYDRFCTTKFDMAEVKKYCESENDDLYGMVEVEKTYITRFTPSKEAYAQESTND